MRLAILLVATTGCAQLLGLEDTKIERNDAPTDAPSVCDGQPACTNTSGRSACGRLFGTGTEAGLPITVPEPTGAACGALATTGPCAFTVTAMPAAMYFAGASAGQVTGQMDDCGRFVVNDIDTAATDIAVFFSNQNGFKNNATILLGRSPTPGVDDTLVAYALSDTTASGWSAQLSTATQVDTSAGYLVRYTRSGVPLADEQVAKDASNPLTNPAGTIPWAAYFGDPAFGALDLALTGTSANGTALAVLGSGTFSLEGFRPGRRCRVMGLQQIANTYIFVLPTDC